MGEKYCIFRMEKIKSIYGAEKRKEHNERKRGKARSDVTDEKPIIIDLVGSDSKRIREEGLSFADVFKEKTEGMTVRSNAVKGFEIVLTYSPGAIEESQLKDWTNKSLEFIKKVFGEENLVSCQLHKSEKTPHIHALALPIQTKENGERKLNANGIIRGPGHLRKLQDDYAKNYMAEFGLKRGVDKNITKAQHERASRWHARQLENERKLKVYETVFGEPDSFDIQTRAQYDMALLDYDESNFYKEESEALPELPTKNKTTDR